jgi:hypothetical protein
MAGNATIANRPAIANRHFFICKLIGSSLWSARISGKSFSGPPAKRRVLIPQMRWEKLFSRHRRTISTGAQPIWSNIAHTRSNAESALWPGRKRAATEHEHQIPKLADEPFPRQEQSLGAQHHAHAVWAIDAIPRIPAG